MSFLGSKAHFKLTLSSFSAHFWLVGLTAKAHVELIFGSSVGRPKLILSSFSAHFELILRPDKAILSGGVSGCCVWRAGQLSQDFGDVGELQI